MQLGFLLAFCLPVSCVDTQDKAGPTTIGAADASNLASLKYSHPNEIVHGDQQVAKLVITLTPYVGGVLASDPDAKKSVTMNFVSNEQLVETENPDLLFDVGLWQIEVDYSDAEKNLLYSTQFCNGSLPTVELKEGENQIAITVCTPSATPLIPVIPEAVGDQVVDHPFAGYQLTFTSAAAADSILATPAGSPWVLNPMLRFANTYIISKPNPAAPATPLNLASLGLDTASDPNTAAITPMGISVSGERSYGHWIVVPAPGDTEGNRKLLFFSHSNGCLTDTKKVSQWADNVEGVAILFNPPIAACVMSVNLVAPPPAEH